MNKPRNLCADGVNTVESKAFQSFTCQVHGRHGGKNILVPNQICKHLNILEDTIIEVAIRTVDFAYAQEYYKVDFYPHDVVCVKCGEKGRLVRFNYCIGVRHCRDKTGGVYKFCYLDKTQADKYLKEYTAKQTGASQ